MNENDKMTKLVKICICVVLVCIACIISGCYKETPPSPPVTSSVQRNDIGVENAYLSEKLEKSDILIPISSKNEKEFEFSEVSGGGITKTIYILKDNKYGNEYIIVSGGNGLGICLRKQD